MPTGICNMVPKSRGYSIEVLNFVSFHQRTPLHMAAQSGHADMVRYLSDKGANVNIKDNDGVSE